MLTPLAVTPTGPGARTPVGTLTPGRVTPTTGGSLGVAGKLTAADSRTPSSAAIQGALLGLAGGQGPGQGSSAAGSRLHSKAAGSPRRSLHEVPVVLPGGRTPRSLAVEPREARARLGTLDPQLLSKVRDVAELLADLFEEADGDADGVVHEDDMRRALLPSRGPVLPAQLASSVRDRRAARSAVGAPPPRAGLTYDVFADCFVHASAKVTEDVLSRGMAGVQMDNIVEDDDEEEDEEDEEELVRDPVARDRLVSAADRGAAPPLPQRKATKP